MASLKVIRADGTESIHEITPAIEYAFEQYAKKGFYKSFREDQLQTRSTTLPGRVCVEQMLQTYFHLGISFLGTLKAVEVLGDDSPNG
jgi:hypothetical protein